MESPERSEAIPPPADQGSPFYKYLCDLSPIKSAKSVHVLQTYAEHYLPPPPAVFTSPANPDRSGGRAKRGLVLSRSASTQVAVSAWDSAPEIQPTQSYISKGYTSDAGHVDACNPTALVASESSQQHILCHKLDRDQIPETSGDIPSNYECGDVSDFLADPSDEGLYATCPSPQLIAECHTLKASPPSEDRGYANGDDLVEAANEESMSTGNQDHCDDAANNVQRNSDAIQGVPDITGHFQLRDCEREDRRESLASRASGSGSDHEGSGHTNAEKFSGLDQAMAALLRSGHSEGFTGQEWAITQQDLSDFSSHRESDISAIERMPDHAQFSGRDDFDFDPSKSLTRQRSAGPDIEDIELEDRKDFLVCETLSQRGVRRRCLDFETSVRRKSMGGVGSRKSFGLRSRTLPGTSAAASSSSIPSSVLCERAVATSDATNSTTETAAAVESHSDMSLRPDCSLAGNRVLSPALVRLTRCGSLRGTDAVSTEQCTVGPARSGRENGNGVLSVGVPSGIGLHLNSLTSSFPFSPTNREFKHTVGIAPGANGAVASLLGMPGVAGMAQDKRSEDFGNGVVNVRAGCSSFSTGSTATSSFSAGGVVISVMERSRVTLRETVMDTPRTMMTSSTLQSLTVGGRQSLEASRITRASALDRKFSSGGKKRFPGQEGLHLDLPDECDSPRSPKRRRKSPTESGEKSGDGCKRCNCKKSKCLKLYCECFAAGTYCSGSCTCHDCFNKPEHKETVTQTRNQITSRNPLAFAPKIVLSKDASPKQGAQVETVVETPSQAAARHKRGCNCKKSLCLKKYCECYQAGVGCSEGCRCEGCKNIYGQKKEVEVSNDKEMVSDALESRSPESELEHARAGSLGDVGSLDQPCNNGKDLSPITPSFQYTGQGRTIGRLRSAGKRLSSSPLSQSQPVPSPSSSARSSINFQSGENFRQASDMLNLSRTSPMSSTPKLSRLNQLSPRWDGLGDICTLTPLPQPPLRPTPASLSTLDRTGASPSFSRQSMEPISSYQPDKLDSVSKGSPRPFRPALHHSPVSSYAARNAQNPGKETIPSTPGLSSSYVAKDTAKASEAKVANFLCEDEDIPDFLKYPDGVNSPAVTKSGSPKQKRVSPPHCEGMGDGKREDGGSVTFRSSPNLRSSRKITLQALPPIPSKSQLGDPCQGQPGGFAK